MEDTIEYQIFVGCNDLQLRYEVVKEKELRELLMQFFQRKRVDFSILSAQGGYCYESGEFILENTLCINIIGSPELDIIALAKSISMYMNQEHVLITRHCLKSEFR